MTRHSAAHRAAHLGHLVRHQQWARPGRLSDFEHRAGHELLRQRRHAPCARYRHPGAGRVEPGADAAGGRDFRDPRQLQLARLRQVELRLRPVPDGYGRGPGQHRLCAAKQRTQLFAARHRLPVHPAGLYGRHHQRDDAQRGLGAWVVYGHGAGLEPAGVCRLRRGARGGRGAGCRRQRGHHALSARGRHVGTCRRAEPCPRHAQPDGRVPDERRHRHHACGFERPGQQRHRRGTHVGRHARSGFRHGVQPRPIRRADRRAAGTR